MVDISLIAMATGFVLILIGLYGALTNGNLLRMVVAFTVADAGVNLVLVSVGYMRGRTAPILDSAVPAAEAVARVIDPVPQALVLTGIVVAVSATALALALGRRLRETQDHD